MHFEHPWWLFVGIAIPIMWALFFLFQRYRTHSLKRLEAFIDKHLLPFLLVGDPKKEKRLWKGLILWSFVFASLTLALAGPRWSFRDMETFSKDQSLVIILDLSESMNATDVKPSRLARAKQKIEDLLKASSQVKIGLIAFAADAHMITPITEDKETIRHILPSLDTDIIYVQGSRLAPAFDMAYAMLEREPGTNKAVLVISDGGFDLQGATLAAKRLKNKGMIIHTMGVGTLEGAPLYGKKNAAPVFSKLESERLKEITKAGGGLYLEATHEPQELTILQDLEKRADLKLSTGKKTFWDERFYLMIIPILPILLWWFRRGYVFAAVIFFLSPSLNLNAEYFKNSEELGSELLDACDYETAAHMFQDPYRKGIAYYRSQNFQEAEKCFRQSKREEVAMHAGYNLGNALVYQQKLKEAVTAYENVLESFPDHENARFNLELVKKMLEDKKKNPDQSNPKSDNKEKNEKDKSQEDKPQQNDDDDDSQENEDDKAQENEDERSQEKEENKEDLEEKEEESNQDNATSQKEEKSQEEQDADFWLNRITNDQKMFMKNKCYIESKKSGTKEGIDPW